MSAQGTALLRELVRPMPLSTYFGRHYGRRPFVVRRRPRLVRRLIADLGASTIQEVLQRRAAPVQAFVRARGEYSVAVPVSPAEALPLYEQGFTILLQGVRELDGWQNALAGALGHPTTSNAPQLCASKAGAVTGWHFDMPENFTMSPPVWPRWSGRPAWDSRFGRIRPRALMVTSRP